MRRAPRAILLFALLWLPAATPLRADTPADTPKNVQLTILHTNDTHGHLLPYSYPDTFDSTSPLAQLTTRHDIGGAARRATLVTRIRHEKGHLTLLLDAGDICDGTPFSTEYHGDADMAAMNAIGYDLACPGNHEYNNTLAQVRKLIGEAHFPLVSANSTVKADGQPLYTPYVIKSIGGARIAFLGLLTYDCRTSPAAREGLAMEPPVEVARRLVPELRKQADLIVAVTHIGVNEDRQLAAQVPGIDVIVGGHSHTLLAKPIFVASTAPSRPHSVNGTVIVQDFQWAGTLGRLDLTLHHSATGTWTVKGYRGALLPVTSSTPEDPRVARVIDTYWKPIASRYAEVIGEAGGDFTEKGPDSAEYNLVADAVRERLGLEFEMENMGGVRAPLVKGWITYGDMVTLDPFNDTVVTFRATGRQLKAILARYRPAVSGIRYVYEGGNVTEASIGGKPIEDERVYSGATNSYYANVILKGIDDRTDTKQQRLDVVLAYVRAHRTIQPAYDGRRVLRGVGDFD